MLQILFHYLVVNSKVKLSGKEGREYQRPDQNGAEDESYSSVASGLGLVFGSQWWVSEALDSSLYEAYLV